ncbi:MAG: tetratricopeptide repeat protein [Armatimonadota bacterium]|nr:tetratricopeptide repeat protein [Armatimonadota bacterium]
MRARAAALGFVLLLTATAGAQGLPAFDTGRLYLREADFNAAIRPYQQAIASDARNARAHYWLGFAYLFAYRQYLVQAAPYAATYLGRAVSPLEEAIKLAPGHPDAYLALHDVYHLMGEMAKADEVIRRMLRSTRPAWLAPVPAPSP